MHTRIRPAPWIRALGTRRFSAADVLRGLRSPLSKVPVEKRAAFIERLVAALDRELAHRNFAAAVAVLACWPTALADRDVGPLVREGLRRLFKTRAYRSLLEVAGGRLKPRKASAPSIAGRLSARDIPEWIVAGSGQTASALAQLSFDVRAYPVNALVDRVASMLTSLVDLAVDAPDIRRVDRTLELLDVFPDVLAPPDAPADPEHFVRLAPVLSAAFSTRLADAVRLLVSRLPRKASSDHDLAVLRAVEGALWRIEPVGPPTMGFQECRSVPSGVTLAQAIDRFAGVVRGPGPLSEAERARVHTVREQVRRARRGLGG